MDLDPVFLARLQFAVTVGFHFLFPPLSIGLAWLLVILEGVGWRKDDENYVRAGKFFGKLLGLTFAVGVATGIVMEFQFGMNWAQYSRFVGDIFGAPLAAEAIFAFFLESGFLGLYLFGRGRISKGLHWFSILMVAVGAAISAFWILVANSWQQTPTGFVVQNGRAELTSFTEAVFNESMWMRFGHTMMASLVSGAFFMAGLSAFLLKRNSANQAARKAMGVALVVGLLGALLTAMPFGDAQGRIVARTQPEKLAAIEGVYDTTSGAPLTIFGLPSESPPDMKMRIAIPKLLSLMAYGDMNATVKGIKDFPENERPPLWITFVSFHNMVALGGLFILLMAVAVWMLRRGTLWTNRRLLQVLICAIPLPLIACQFGWVATEVGRQPWVVYKVLRTADAVSSVVSADEILFSLMLFSAVYFLLGALYIFLIVKKVQHQAHEQQSLGSA